MALETKCQTPDCRYNISIKDTHIVCEVIFTPLNEGEGYRTLDLSPKEAELLERNLHNAIELVLSKYFYDGKQHELKKT